MFTHVGDTVDTPSMDAPGASLTSALSRMTRKALFTAPLLAAAFLAPQVQAEGTRNLHPAAGHGSTGHRGVMDARGNELTGGVARNRQFLYVYAEAGEHILLGSRNRANGGDMRIWAEPVGGFGTKGDETIPANSAAVFRCATYAGADTSVGTIANRDQELAGPNSADGSATVPNGYTPCVYQVPTTGFYGVVFTGATNSGEGNSADIANPPILGGGLVSAWDVTVRSSDPASLDDLNGRVFTYLWTVQMGSTRRYLTNDLYYVTADGYRYRQTFREIAPFGALFYANSMGFTDDGAPLYHDVRGSNHFLANLIGSPLLALQPPEYPIFFSDVDPTGPNAAEVDRVLTALSIPLAPAQPQLSNPHFVGNITGNQSTVSAGGLFTFDTQNTLTYEIVISRDGVNFDPGNVLNRVLTGVAASGSHSVVWDGLDNDGNAFPAGNYQFRIFGRNGEIHFPMIDVEGNALGGPTLERLNGFDAADRYTVYFDDRGYRTSDGTLVGELNGHLCGAGSPIAQPTPNHSLIGVNSNDDGGTGQDYYRKWTGGTDSNRDCENAANEYFGTAKGLDLWALERSPHLELPIIIVDATCPVDVGTQVNVPATAMTGDTVLGHFSFTNAGSAQANGVTYSATIGNPATPATCPAAVNFTLLPAGVTATYNAATCAVTFTGMPASLDAGQTLYFSFNYDLAATNPGPVPVHTEITSTNENCAAANAAENQATGTTTIPTPQIAVSKTANPAAGEVVNVGDVITYTLEAVITDAALTADLVLTDALGAGLTFGSVTNAGSFNCAGSVVCTLPAGTAVGTYTVTYTATVSAGAPANVANNVTATGGGNTPPTCAACSVTHPLAAPAITLDKTAGAPSGNTAGSTIVYTFVVTNTGNVALSNVAVNDPLLGGAVACPATTLAVGANMTCTATYTLTQADVNNGVVNNAATASGTSPTGTNVSDNDNTSTPITQIATLTIVKSVTSNGPYTTGSTITYSFLVTNTGNVDLSNVSVTDTLPGLSAIACPGNALAVGADMTCTATYVVTAADVAAGNVHNSATASGTPPATPGNPNPNPVVSPPSEVDTPLVPAQLSINKTGPATAQRGQDIVFTVVVSNTGTVPAHNVTVTDPTPTGLNFVSNTGDCTTAFPCDLGTMNPGESRTITVTLHVPAAYAGPSTITNVATVSSSSTSGDSSSSASSVLAGAHAPNLVPIPVDSLWAMLLLGMGMLLIGGGVVRRQLG